MKVLPVPCLEDNFAYLVFDEETGDAAAIDPVLPDQVLQAAQLNGAEVKMVLTTHHHWDHAGGNNGTKKLLKEVPIYGGVKDDVEGCSHPVQHGDEFSISPTIRVKCLDTPCHTKGHISYFITSTLAGDKPVVFTGDTLFRGGCGRSFEGTPDQMYNSLCKTLASLPPETQVYCGHEDHSISTRMEIDVRGEGHSTIRRSEDGHEPAGKKLKRDNGDVEMGLRQTAEIVMVLVGVAALRGGAQPSPLECQLAAQAYEKLATLVTVSAPQDLVSKNALQSLIQQLTVPPPTPARPAAKLIAFQSSTASLSAPPTPTPASSPSSAPSAAAQAGATPSPLSSPSVSPSPSPAPGLVPVSAGSSSETGPAVTQAVATTSKAVVSAPKAGSPALETAKTLALEQVQTPSSSLDNAAPSSSPATTTNVSGKTRSSAPASSTSVPVAISTTQTLRTKSGGRTSPAGISSADAQPTTTVTIKDQRGSQAPKALARQRGSKSVVPEQPVVLDPVEIHRQIALAVQLLLKPYIITTALSKTAGNYMNTPISCGICKVGANTTNNVLVCDGCECGFHLQCLQLSSTTSIPKGDWYCPKCVTTNAGRPQPPKYGPLRRGPAGQSGPKNSWSMQAGRGSDASKGQSPGKLLLQSRRKELDAVEPSSPPLGACTSCRPEAVARRHSMEDYARDRAQKSGVSEQEASDQSLKLEWLGPVVSSGQEKLYYSACSVGGVTVRLQDAAFFRPEAPDVPPYIARLQALWEDKSSGQKWVKVNWCYYPSDLPVNSGRPVIRDPREVYESNHSDNNLVGSIQGPCLVLSPLKYQEELDRRSKHPIEDPIPLFLCQWFYDAPKGLFRAPSEDSS